MKLKVESKGYFINRLVDGIKETVMDENNPAYGIQKDRVSKDFKTHPKFAHIEVYNENTIGLKMPNQHQISDMDRSGYGTIINLSHPQEEEEEEEYDDLFPHIVGLQQQKELFKTAIRKFETTGEPTNILLVGSPAGGKSMFIEAIRRTKGSDVIFVDGTQATKEGMIEAMFRNKAAKYICIEEIDKMSQRDQRGLLLLMSANEVSETKLCRTRKMELKASIFATANNLGDIPRELRSRFFVAKVRDYTFAEFGLITRKYCEDKFPVEVADYLADKVYNDVGSKDFRDVVKLCGLCKNKADVDLYTELMKDE